jgi:IS5 family transposase
LRAICGWKYVHQLPHESTFSRAFAEFAQMQLPQFVHEALIRETQKDRMIGHIARDSTAIEVREGHVNTARQRSPRPKSQARGRSKTRKPRKPRKAGDPPTRLERQRTMSLEQMLAELPCYCSISAKKSSDGHNQYWCGYKLHLDVADGQIPISAVLTAAHVHDSQVAIPLSTMTGQRVTPFYELMDAAYDAQEIMDHVRSQGRVPIIDPKNCGRPSKNVIVRKYPRQLSWAEEQRYRERTMIERVNGRLKDEFGARFVRVRGGAKVMAHLMFGVLALTADQLLRFVSDSS